MYRLRLVAAAIAGAGAIAVGAAQPGPAPAAAQTIQLWSFGIGPRPIHLAAGRPVTLNFVNESGSSHDFTAREFFAASSISAGAAPGGEVELRGHQSRTITLVPRAGTYKAHCGHFMHDSLGMHDMIVVD